MFFLYLYVWWAMRDADPRTMAGRTGYGGAAARAFQVPLQCSDS
jgi:hypothetical protein